MNIADVLILGGGPTGLYAAYYAGLRGLTVEIIDSYPQLGGQLTTIYPEKFIYNVPGFVRISAKDLAQNLVEQAMTNPPGTSLGQEIIDLSSRHEGDTAFFSLETKPEGKHYGKTLLMTAAPAMLTPRTLPLADALRLEGKGVSYIVTDKEQLRAKKVLVVGGGDSALDWVSGLIGHAKEVILIHRGDVFTAHEESIKRLQSLPVTVKLLTEIKAICGKKIVESVILRHNRTGVEEELAIDAIVLKLGFLPSPIPPFSKWGLKIENDYVVVNTKMETSRAGIYAAGDVATYEGKVKLIVTGFGEAALAVNAIKEYLAGAQG